MARCTLNQVWVVVLAAAGMCGCRHQSPSFSPDGRQIAHGSAKGLVIQSVANPRNQVVLSRDDVESVRWSPDGGTIAFAETSSYVSLSEARSTRTGRSWLYDVAAHRTDPMPIHLTGPLVWRSDGRVIAGVVQPHELRGAPTETETAPAWLAWYEPSTSRVRHSPRFKGEIANPVWLSGDLEVAAVHDGGLYVFTPNGIRKLTNQAGYVALGSAGQADTLLAARVTAKGSEYRCLLSSIDARTGVETGLDSPSLLRQAAGPRAMSVVGGFSPDGKWVAGYTLVDSSPKPVLRKFIPFLQSMVGARRTNDRIYDPGDQTAITVEPWIASLDGKQVHRLMRVGTAKMVVVEFGWTADCSSVAVAVQLYKARTLRDVVRVYRTNGTLAATLEDAEN